MLEVNKDSPNYKKGAEAPILTLGSSRIRKAYKKMGKNKYPKQIETRSQLKKGAEAPILV